MQRLLNILGFISVIILIVFLIGSNTLPSGGLKVAFDHNGAGLVQAQSVQPGDGLQGTYFQDHRCSGTSKTQIDPRIDFPDDRSFGQGYHDPCIRWTGQIYIEGGSGNYTFYTRNDDGVTVRVNNQAIIEDPTTHPPKDFSGSLNLDEKKRYDIDIEFFDRGGGGTIILEYSGPGVSKQVIPQRVLYSSRVKCSDSSDNDGDGKVDFPDDPGCESAHDDDETDPACMDGQDNDNDGFIDFGDDVGCESENDNSEENDALPACSDRKDNDGDGLFDFPDDKGCSSATDNDESNPACNDGIDNDGDGAIDFPHDVGCGSASDESESNPACSDNLDNDGDGQTDFPNDRGCEGPLDADETNPPIDRSIRLGSGGGGQIDPDKYPISVLANEQNNYHARVRQGESFEFVPMSTQVLPRSANDPLQNGELYFFILEGEDSDAQRHITLKPGRYWDRSTFNDPSHTNQALLDYFSVGGNLDRCIAAIQDFPTISSFVGDPVFFQTFLDMLMLCEQTLPGSVPPPPAPEPPPAPDPTPDPPPTP